MLLRIVLLVAGCLLVSVGAGLIYLPAGLIVGGVLAGAAALLAEDDGRLR